MLYYIRNLFGVSKGINYDNYTVGDAYIIYAYDDDFELLENNTYYYPVYYQDENVLTLSVIQVDDEQWATSICKNEIDGFSESMLKYDSAILLYTYKGVLFGENNSGLEIISEIPDEDRGDVLNDAFIKESYNDKILGIEECGIEIHEVIPSSELIIAEDNIVYPTSLTLSYTPGFSTNNSTCKMLDIWDYRFTIL